MAPPGYRNQIVEDTLQTVVENAIVCCAENFTELAGAIHRDFISGNDILLDDNTIVDLDHRVRNAYKDSLWLGVLALLMTLSTIFGNILVCLAIVYDRRLHNVTNYFLVSLALTDLSVAVLVMPIGIFSLIKGILLTFCEPSTTYQNLQNITLQRWPVSEY